VSCTICSSRSRWPVWKLLDTHTYDSTALGFELARLLGAFVPEAGILKQVTLSPWRKFILEKLIVAQLAKKSPSSYGTLMHGKDVV